MSGSPLVVQITQILQSSGAGRCERGKRMKGVSEMQDASKDTDAYHTSVKSIARVQDCIHGDGRHKQLLFSLIQ